MALTEHLTLVTLVGPNGLERWTYPPVRNSDDPGLMDEHAYGTDSIPPMVEHIITREGSLIEPDAVPMLMHEAKRAGVVLEVGEPHVHVMGAGWKPAAMTYHGAWDVRK